MLPAVSTSCNSNLKILSSAEIQLFEFITLLTVATNCLHFLSTANLKCSERVADGDSCL